MNNNILEKSNISLEKIKQEIDEANNIVLTTHISPDGDAIGAVLGLYLILKEYVRKTSKSKSIQVVIDDELPKYANNFEKSDVIQKYDNFDIDNFDLLISVDSANVERIGNVAELGSKAKTSINIDHHISNSFYFDYNYVENTSSTSEIIYKFINIFNVSLDKEMAKYLYLGIVNDTGNFFHDNVTASTFEIASHLISTGINNNEIVRALFSNSVEKVNLIGELYRNKQYDEKYKFMYYYLSDKKMKEMGLTKDDTDGIAEILLRIEEVDISLFIKEEEDKSIKGSLRSKDEYNVNEIASAFGGGGHIKAAGFKTNKNANEIIETIKSKIEEQYNKKTLTSD